MNIPTPLPRVSEYIKVGREYKHICEDCIHYSKINQHCKAYKSSILMLDVKECKRRKEK